MNAIIILAGGKGTRMNCNYPKVLHKISGISMINRVMNVAERVSKNIFLIVGFKREEVMKEVGDRAQFIFQEEQLGTGHAILCAKDNLKNENYENILVLPGDHPLISQHSVEGLILRQKETGAPIVLASVTVSDFENERSCFFNCGRIIRSDEGEVERIVELKDASDEQKEIKELNVSYYCFDADWLWENIEKLGSNNASKEYYLTDLIELARSQGQKIESVILDDYREGMGVNSPEQSEVVSAVLSD